MNYTGNYMISPSTSQIYMGMSRKWCPFWSQKCIFEWGKKGTYFETFPYYSLLILGLVVLASAQVAQRRSKQLDDLRTAVTGLQIYSPPKL